MPSTAFIGVRISWLMLARNWPFASDARCACSVARTRSVTSKRKMAVWPSSRRRSTMRSQRPDSPSPERNCMVPEPARCCSMRSAIQASRPPGWRLALCAVMRSTCARVTDSKLAPGCSKAAISACALR